MNYPHYKIGDSLIIAAVACILGACGGGGGGDRTGFPPQTPGIPTHDLQFFNENFTDIDIRNSFAFVVQRGDQFAIDVTIDANYSHLVSVTQKGIQLRVEFDPTFTGDIRAQIARGVITLPTLDKLAVTGSAIVDVAGFNQSFLQIAQSGSSQIDGANSSIDLVTATLDGNSHLSLQNVAPLAAADITATGSTQTTLNMMTGGTLTGSASGSSNISYYGSSVSQQVTTNNSATVTWLGASPN